MSFASNFENNNYKDTNLDARIYHNLHHMNLFITSSAHAKEVGELTAKLDQQIKEMKEKNHELEVAQKNYKTVTQKIDDVAKEHPVPGVDNGSFSALVHKIAKLNNTILLSLLISFGTAGLVIYQMHNKKI